MNILACDHNEAEATAPALLLWSWDVSTIEERARGWVELPCRCLQTGIERRSVGSVTVCGGYSIIGRYKPALNYRSKYKLILSPSAIIRWFYPSKGTNHRLG